MPRKSPCKYGRKKSARRGCKAKPGPKRSVRRSTRRCSRGVKRSPPRKGSCRRKPGPKMSRSSSKRSSRKLKADYGKYLYYIKGKDLWQTPRAKQSGQKKIIKRNAVNKREKGYLYYPKMVNGELQVRRRRMNWN
tara:strand:- start:350 stop:754 length:405 start_codon:yes stop_codon:yes gene_type:complete